MANGELPPREEIEQLLAAMDAIIGLGGSFPASRFSLTPSRDCPICRVVVSRRGRIASIARPRIPLLSSKSTPDTWWPVGMVHQFGESIGNSRFKPRVLYADLLPELDALRDIINRGGADTRHEAMRELRESLRRTNEVFVIMALRPEVEEFYANAIDPAARALGLDPFPIDRRETEEAIGEAILSSIRRSLFAVCDLTFARPNCYFEAGYAKGAFRRVIFTARADHNTRAGATGELKVHFDVDQFRITWSDRSDFQRAREEFHGRLQMLVGGIRTSGAERPGCLPSGGNGR